MNDAKPFWESKTFWFNAFVLGLGILSFLVYDPTASTMFREDVIKIMVLVLGIGNLILRFLTKQPITLKRQNK